MIAWYLQFNQQSWFDNVFYFVPLSLYDADWENLSTTLADHKLEHQLMDADCKSQIGIKMHQISGHWLLVHLFSFQIPVNAMSTTSHEHGTMSCNVIFLELPYSWFAIPFWALCSCMLYAKWDVICIIIRKVHQCPFSLKCLRCTACIFNPTKAIQANPISLLTGNHW